MTDDRSRQLSERAEAESLFYEARASHPGGQRPATGKNLFLAVGAWIVGLAVLGAFVVVVFGGV